MYIERSSVYFVTVFSAVDSHIRARRNNDHQCGFTSPPEVVQVVCVAVTCAHMCHLVSADLCTRVKDLLTAHLATQ